MTLKVAAAANVARTLLVASKAAIAGNVNSANVESAPIAWSLAFRRLP